MITTILAFLTGLSVAYGLYHVYGKKPPTEDPTTVDVPLEETTVAEEDEESEVDPMEGISEPVISMAQCIKDNPSRFQLSEVFLADSKTIDHWNVWDRVTGRVYRVEILYSYYLRSEGRGFLYKLPNDVWMTGAEQTYLIKTFMEMYELRASKVKQYKNDKRRKLMMGLYCDETGEDLK